MCAARIMGVNSVAGTVTNLAVNFAIWRMPNADPLLIWTMLVVGPMLALVGVIYLFVEITRGPLPMRRLNVTWRLCRVYMLVWHRLEWRGRSYLPHDGPAILVSNHTTGLDPLLIQAAYPRTVHWVMLTSYRFAVLNWLWRMIEPICLNRDASNRGAFARLCRR